MRSRVNGGVGNCTPWGRSGGCGLMLACSTWLLTVQSVRSLGLFFGRMWTLELPSVEGPREEISEPIQLVAIRLMVVPAGSNVRVWKRWPGSIGCVGSPPFCLFTGLGGGDGWHAATVCCGGGCQLVGPHWFSRSPVTFWLSITFFACTREPWTAPCESERKWVVGDRLHCAFA